MNKTHELDKLVPTSTDMGVAYMCNTDKIVPSEEMWKYGDYDDESEKEKKEKRKEDDNLSDGELDANIDTYVNKSVFRKDHKNDHKHENISSKRDTDREDRADTEGSKSDSDRASGILKDKELLFKKLDMMRKLGELKQCGVLLSRNYSIDSDLELMECEYKLHHDIRSKQNSVKWMSHMLIGIVKGTEMFNDGYNPFDIKLSGLSNAISSDMHNYYSVLGDIYEKYNHPGKEMGPEMRLLLMLSGTALSMQVSKILPTMTGGGGNTPSSEVRNEEILNELRKKAEQDSNLVDEKTKEYMKKQHDAAAQKVADLKMIQDKELEYQKISKLLNTKNGNMKNFKENLLLSESPKQADTDKQSIDQTQELRLTQEEIEHIQKIKNMEEQHHLEMMRRIAHQKSESFRNNLHQISRDDKRRQELNLQNQQLDKIINNIDGSGINQSKPNQLKSTQPKSTQTKSNRTKSVQSQSVQQSQSEDTKSIQSNESSISVNPKIGNIMSRSKYTSKQNTKKMFAPTIDDVKLDDNIKLLLEQNDSDYDNLSKDDMSVGSSKDKKDGKKRVDHTQMSFGSKTKGTKPMLKTGK